MKVALVGPEAEDRLTDAIRAFGWEIADLAAPHLDALLGWGGFPANRQAVAIHLGSGLAEGADDFAEWPSTEESLAARIEFAKARRAGLRRLAHDLRTPLNAISGYAEMIAEEADGEIARYAKNIRTAAKTLEEGLRVLSGAPRPGP